MNWGECFNHVLYIEGYFSLNSWLSFKLINNKLYLFKYTIHIVFHLLHFRADFTHQPQLNIPKKKILLNFCLYTLSGS